MSWIKLLRMSGAFRVPMVRACKPFLAVGAAGIVLALISSGCSTGGSPNTVDPKGEAVHIYKAANHVGKYIKETKGKAPKDTGELKDWAAKNNIPQDELLSTRDHEPYEVHEATKGRMNDLVVTEKTGAKGKKFMWRNGPSRIGIEVEQADIDSAINPSRGGTRPPR